MTNIVMANIVSRVYDVDDRMICMTVYIQWDKFYVRFSVNTVCISCFLTNENTRRDFKATWS